VRVLALDYGAARTGVAGLGSVGDDRDSDRCRRAGGDEDGLERLSVIVREHDVERVVVGLPLTPRGEVGEQARETLAFAEALGGILPVPVEFYDERFTTTLAAGTGGAADEDARAAAFLLESYLRRTVGT
jgi:putative Holliday junction resolvase